MTRMLDKILRRSDAIDKESLCILAGQRVRRIHLVLLHAKKSCLLGLASPSYSPLSRRRRKHARLCLSRRHRCLQTLSSARSRSHWRRRHRGSYITGNALLAIKLKTRPLVIACTGGARPRTARYSSHTVLHHVCIFPRSNDASCRGPLVTGAKTKRRDDEHRAQSTTRNLRLAQGRRRANGTRRDTVAAQRCCSFCKRFG